MILVVAAISMIFGLLSLNRLKTEYSVMQFLPAHHPALKMDQAIRKRFNIEDRPVFIGILNLRKSEAGNWLIPDRVQRLTKLTESIKAMPDVEMVLDVANVVGAASIDNALSVGELVQVVPPKDLSQRILNDILLTPNLISTDGRSILVYVELKTAAVSTMVHAEAELKSKFSTAFPEAITSVGGVPAIQTDLGLLLNKELVNFLLLTILACALTLLIIFSTYSTIMMPLILTLYCNLMVFAMMAWTGITFTVLTSTVPILVFIDVMTISCHILLRYNEEAQKSSPGETKWQLILRTTRLIWIPNAVGSLTTSVGFLTLLLSDVPLIRTYGIAVAVSILLSSALTAIGMIPLLLFFPAPTPRAWVHKPARWSLWVMENRKAVLGGTIALCFVFAFIGRHLDWTGRLFDDLPKEQEARRSTEEIDRSMGGVVPLEIVVKTPKGSDWVEPKRIAKLDHLLMDLRKIPGVGIAQSIPDFLRASALTKSSIPKTRAGISEIYFLYTLSSTNPLNQYLTSDNKSARIQLKMHDLPADQVKKLLVKLTRRTQTEFPDSTVQIGGMGAVVHAVHNEISHDLIFGFWQALFLIVGLLTFVFRSLRWSLVAAIPNLVPPVLLLGYLSLTHTPIKPSVAIIFSIALGLAFTNTVYVLNRLRELRQSGRRLPVGKTFYLEGNPCLVSTLVVMMGFSVFLFSYFELNRTFGACMLVSIVAGILGDLIFLPALLKSAPWLLGQKATLVQPPIPPSQSEDEVDVQSVPAQAA